MSDETGNKRATDSRSINENYEEALWRIHQREWPVGDRVAGCRHATEMWDIADAALQGVKRPLIRGVLDKCLMTSCSGDGEYQIKISFETLAEMQAAHSYLLALTARPEPPSEADAMSDDIVKRLRGIWRDPASIPRIELDAADEIERLREENRKLRDAARKMTQGDLMP